MNRIKKTTRNTGSVREDCAQCSSLKEDGSARQTQRERESAEQQQSRTRNDRTNKPLTASRSAAAGAQWVVCGRGMGGRESGRQTKRQAEAHARTADYVSCSSLAVLPTLSPPASCFNDQRNAAALWLTLTNLLSHCLLWSITNYNSISFAYSNYYAI